MNMKQRSAYGCAAAALMLSTVTSSSLLAASERSELPSVVVITKSSNKNQVHYAAAVDESCAPLGVAPLRAYWRMLERGPDATEPLSSSEDAVLGVDHQKVGDGAVEFSLRGMPARSFMVHTLRGTNGRCASWVGTTIAGTPARLASVHVQQGLFGTVDYVLVRGFTDTGKTVEERIDR
jgi:hypothetical protein